MPLQGRGSSSCLMCDHPGKLIQIFPHLIEGIKKLYESGDKFSNMLKASRICVECAGRFFQLFEFNTIKEAMGNSSQQNLCHLCLSEHVMFEDVAKEAVEALEQTRWSQQYPDFVCCFACCNFLRLCDKIKTTLDQQRLEFMARIGKCHVKIGRCPDDDSDADSEIAFSKDTEATVEQPLSTDESPADPAVTETEEASLALSPEVMHSRSSLLPGEIAVETPVTEEETTIPNVPTLAIETPPDVVCSQSPSQIKQESTSDNSSSGESEQAPIVKRTRQNTILARLSIGQDINGNQLDVDDKFTAIKNRRGKHRSNDLKALPVRKRKSLETIKIGLDKEVTPSKKRRNTMNWSNRTPQCDAVMATLKSKPLELKEDSKLIEQTLVVPKQEDEIIDIYDSDPAMESPEVLRCKASADELLVAKTELKIKCEEIELQHSSEPSKYKNLRYKLHKASVDKKIKTEHYLEISTHGKKTIAMSEVLGAQARLSGSRKPRAAKAAPKVQRKILKTDEISHHDAIDTRIAQEKSELHCATPPVCHESESVKTMSDNSFESQQAELDSANINDYALFPHLDDTLAVAAEVTISDLDCEEEPEIPLQAVTESARPTAEEIERFNLLKCSVVLERHSADLRLSQVEKVVDKERFTKCGRKCLMPRKLMISEDESEPPVKQKKVTKKAFAIRLVPESKPTKHESKKQSQAVDERPESPKPKHKKKSSHPKKKKSRNDKHKKSKQHKPKETTPDQTTLDLSDSFGEEYRDLEEDFVDFTTEDSQPIEEFDIQTPEASIPKTVQNFMQSYSCEVTETQEMEFLDKNQQHKDKLQQLVEDLDL